MMAQATPASTPVLQARGLVKRYGHVTALDGADLDLLPGEILAVIGDNGAGKSTLVKALSGALVPDAGEIRVDGRAVKFQNPSDARRQGIETVYQDLAVAPAMTVAENLFLGREIRRPGLLGSVFRLIDKKRMLAEAALHLQSLRIDIASMQQPVESLSGGQRQGVAVARSAAFARHVVIMDEPTAALGTKQTDIVYESIRSAAARGLAVVVISHDIPKMLSLADRFAVMRHGRTVLNTPARDLTLTDVVTLMLGGKAKGAAA
jgi:fructose transport system ATP-binding protein